MTNLTLNQRLSYIGVRLAGTYTQPIEKIWIDIEETIYDATLEVKNDGRLFMLLCSWVGVHGKQVVIEKLLNLQKKENLLGYQLSPSLLLKINFITGGA